MQEVIRANSNKSAQDIVNKMIEEVEKFRQPADQEDDITLVVVKIIQKQ